MSIADAIASKRERLFEVMLATTDSTLQTPEAFAQLPLTSQNGNVVRELKSADCRQTFA